MRAGKGGLPACADHRIGLTLKILSNQIRRAMDLAMSERVSPDITAFHSRIIGFLDRESQSGDVFQKDIERNFDIRRSTATGMLKLMEKNGLIVRSPVPYDARLKKILLTQKALQLCSEARRQLDFIENRLVQSLSDREFELFFTITDKLSAAVAEAAADSRQ